MAIKNFLINGKQRSPKDFYAFMPEGKRVKAFAYFWGSGVHTLDPRARMIANGELCLLTADGFKTFENFPGNRYCEMLEAGTLEQLLDA